MNRILINAINLNKLVKTNPELFNLTILSLSNKIELLKRDPKFYIDRLYKKDPSLGDKVEIVLEVEDLNIQEKFKLTDEDIQNVDDRCYLNLLDLNFSKYIRKEKFKTLPKAHQVDIFLKEPEWALENLDKIPSFSSEKLSTLAHRKPVFVDKFIEDFSQYSTNAFFWQNMIKFNKKYIDVFLANTNTLITKTDVRQVCKCCPEIIKKLNVDIMDKSKLTCKEWILLSSSIIGVGHKTFKNWTFSDDMIDAFKLELTAEMLSGKSKMSKRFQYSMKNVFDDKRHLPKEKKTVKIIEESDDWV
jgi:hypothetical protein